MDWTLVGGYLLIFVARIVDVSLGTIRTLMVVRQQRLQAAVVGFFEILVYILALAQVIGTLTEPGRLLVYALGFATGNFVGSYLEEKMALGVLTVQIIPTRGMGTFMANSLRKDGFGVTVLTGQGREGMRKVLLVTLSRRKFRQLLSDVDDMDPGAFVTALDTRQIRGGVFTSARKGK